MFSIFKSEQSKLRDTAKNWLYLSGKVYHYRKDRLSETDLSKLVQLSEEVRSQMKAKDTSRLRSSIEALKDHMDQVGGNYYPRGSMAENVEFFFAALIIYVGVTTFFVKPFKIPTNSMWPTYHGMTGEVYHADNPAPNALERAFRLVAFGASHFDVTAPADGELLIPMVRRGNGYDVFTKPANVKRYFVLNAPGREYPFFVGNQQTSFKLPQDFKLEKQVLEPLAKAGKKSPYDLIPRGIGRDDIATSFRDVEVDPRTGQAREVTIYLVKTGMTVKKGDPLLTFDLMTGDQLFVDRMSYHFVSPKVGDGFVFKTGAIPRITDDVFYIKRLAGTPGDTVRIEDGGLIVNGEPATGSKAFAWNANKEGKYAGYTASPQGGVVVDLSSDQTIPEGDYLALGDNSYNSFDGRGWGYVPEEAVVGRPIMIYYPFTKRFGLAK